LFNNDSRKLSDSLDDVIRLVEGSVGWTRVGKIARPDAKPSGQLEDLNTAEAVTPRGGGGGQDTMACRGRSGKSVIMAKSTNGVTRITTGLYSALGRIRDERNPRLERPGHAPAVDKCKPRT